jgi:maleylpyruvate isomerase
LNIAPVPGDVKGLRTTRPATFTIMPAAPDATDPAGTLVALRADIAACRSAHDHLLAVIGDLTDADVRAPSALPDWTVGHVLTHLARNGDSVVHLTEAIGRGEVEDQYPGGATQRSTDIEAGSSRHAAELLADVREVNERVHRAWDALTDEQWLTGLARTASMREMPATYLPVMRCREVVVHTSDLGLPTATWREWPDAFVSAELVRLLEMLPSRLDPAGARELVAQLMGRREGPMELPSVMW